MKPIGYSTICSTIYSTIYSVLLLKKVIPKRKPENLEKILYMYVFCDFGDFSLTGKAFGKFYAQLWWLWSHQKCFEKFRTCTTLATLVLPEMRWISRCPKKYQRRWEKSLTLQWQWWTICDSWWRSLNDHFFPLWDFWLINVDFFFSMLRSSSSRFWFFFTTLQ